MLCYSTQHIKKLKNISMEIFQQVPKKISMKTFFFFVNKVSFVLKFFHNSVTVKLILKKSDQKYYILHIFLSKYCNKKISEVAHVQQIIQRYINIWHVII